MDNKLLLGQVFTSSKLAKFMWTLADLHDNSEILDPCIGPNTFFNNLDNNRNIALTGIELDNSLISEKTKSFFNKANRYLLNTNFFDYSTINKFDTIIVNPPYVRQELLDNTPNDKVKILESIQALDLNIPRKSNLYVYFLIKCILHLKDKGCLIAVYYDSWLYSKFGKELKEAFRKIGFIDSVYHFKKSAFLDADIGATVIKFIKTTTDKKIAFYQLNDLDDLDDLSISTRIEINQKKFFDHPINSSNIFKTENNFFISIKDISADQIKRGNSAKINRFFLFTKKKHPELTTIIKNVFDIKTYCATESNTYILNIEKSISPETLRYIKQVKTKIMEASDNKFITMKDEIKKRQDWYKLRLNPSGNIIFNYYLRNNIDFIYNPNKLLVSDNFYSFSIDYNVYCHIAILNSTFTKLNVIEKSRNQGHGLRKLQKYEFIKVKIVNPENLLKKSICELEECGKELLTMNRYKNEQKQLIQKVDSILLNEYNRYFDTSITYKELRNELNGNII